MNFDERSYTMASNLSELPYTLFSQLAHHFDSPNMWQKIFSDDKESIYYLSADEVERYGGTPNPGANLLRQLGARGETVQSLLKRLHALAKIYGELMDRPQLTLRRKFCPVIWAQAFQIKVSRVDSETNQVRMECKASGFPTPRYQWLEDGEQRPIQGATSKALVITNCPCTTRSEFRCKVWNEIEAGFEWSDFYRLNGKQFYSELISKPVDLSQYASQVDTNCPTCNKKNLDNICRLVRNMSATETNQDDEALLTTMTGEIVATDKVALIISNRTYAPLMTNLITPFCDAEALSEALQQMKFKTVTLGDLTLNEMKFIVQEYRKLLGDGVYAVFYFVGHGFEANGQCYLLPIGAPAENYGPEDCLSMDWVMSIFKEYNPALNLILLDICRKFLPSNLDIFNNYAAQYRQDIKINRNTIYGYATSGGVGAYEVRGEKNGVFMKYLKNRINQRLPVLDMLNKVFRDIEKDEKVRDVQIPELRSNITKPRSLLDPLIFDGHTNSYEHHTTHWRLMHELPTPVYVDFPEQQLQVTIWFDYCGHFTNKVYVFSSVGELPNPLNSQEVLRRVVTPSTTEVDPLNVQNYLAFLKFSEEFEISEPKFCEDDEEGVSVYVMLSNLQRSKGGLNCCIELVNQENHNEIIASRETSLGHCLITITNNCNFG